MKLRITLNTRLKMKILTRLSFMIGLVLPFSLLTMIRPSQSAPSSGMIAGKLKPCPDSPNCFCTENKSGQALKINHTHVKQAWQALQQVVIKLGGHIVEEKDSYLHAEFSSRWFGFIDDLEARLDSEQKLIQLRSASRSGYYDFGVNRKRVNLIKKQVLLRLSSLLNIEKVTRNK